MCKGRTGGVHGSAQGVHGTAHIVHRAYTARAPGLRTVGSLGINPDRLRVRGPITKGPAMDPDRLAEELRPSQALVDSVRELRAEIETVTNRETPRGWDDLPVDSRPTKTRVTIRVDSDVVRWFRDMGPGWQTRLNEVLRLYYEHRRS